MRYFFLLRIYIHLLSFFEFQNFFLSSLEINLYITRAVQIIKIHIIEKNIIFIIFFYFLKRPSAVVHLTIGYSAAGLTRRPSFVFIKGINNDETIAENNPIFAVLSLFFVPSLYLLSSFPEFATKYP